MIRRTKENIEYDITKCEKDMLEASGQRQLLLEELTSHGDNDPVQLHNLWTGTYISLVSDPDIDGLLRFQHIDGNIAICYDIHGDRVNLMPLSEVYIWGFGAEVEVRNI